MTRKRGKEGMGEKEEQNGKNVNEFIYNKAFLP